MLGLGIPWPRRVARFFVWMIEQEQAGAMDWPCPFNDLREYQFNGPYAPIGPRTLPADMFDQAAAACSVAGYELAEPATLPRQVSRPSLRPVSGVGVLPLSGGR